MNKKAKVFLMVFFAVIFCLFILGVFLTGFFPQKGNPYEFVGVDNGWNINKTQIELDVAKDRTVKVVERYEVEFFTPSYSMYRVLPLTQNERYFDIKGSVLERNYTVSTETGFFSDAGGNLLFVYIDMPSRQTGIFNFEISYTIIPRAELGNTDRFYMNVVGYGFSTAQSNVSVVAKFPSNVDMTNSAIYAGAWGTTDKLTAANYSIDGNTISISGISLDPFSGITTDFVFPDKPFTLHFDFYVLMALVVGLALLALMYFIKSFFAKNYPIVPIVNFYPPKDEDGRELTPVELGYLIDNNVEPADVTAMIYYFASKGYLKIKDEDGKNISLEKVMDLPQSAQSIEKTIFNAIFSKAPVASMRMLEKSFPMAVTTVINNVKSKYSGKTFEKKNSALTIFGFIVVCAVMSIYAIVASFRVFPSIVFSSLLVFLPLIALSGFGTYICTRYHKFSSKTRFYFFLAYGGAAFIVGLLIAFSMGGAAMSHLERAVLLAFVVASSMITPFFAKRTEYYNKRLNDIVGFRNFLETTEKDRLEKLLESNPNYYYDILPYANVLGVSDIWADKFAKLQVPPPTYYYSSSNTLFNIMVFNSVFRNSTSSITKSVAAAHRDSGGFKRGGFGGGGFGGGGFGGGGGGRR